MVERRRDFVDGGFQETVRTSVRRSITALEGPMSARAYLAGLRLAQAMPRRTSPTLREIEQEEGGKKVRGKPRARKRAERLKKAEEDFLFDHLNTEQYVLPFSLSCSPVVQQQIPSFRGGCSGMPTQSKTHTTYTTPLTIPYTHTKKHIYNLQHIPHPSPPPPLISILLSPHLSLSSFTPRP